MHASIFNAWRNNVVLGNQTEARRMKAFPYSAVDKPSLEHHVGNEDLISCMLTKTGPVLLVQQGLTEDI